MILLGHAAPPDNNRIFCIIPIIGKTKSTNFQNEKYKKGMSFKYYINGA